MTETSHPEKQDYRWFHSIDLGDEVSTSRFNARTPPNYTLFGFFEIAKDIDFAGLTCVDVGTMDGLAAFVMRQAGAEKVIATDLAERQSFRYARDKLGLEVEYRVPVQALDLPAVLAGDEPDIIHLSGILYHVIDPVSVLMACRYALKTDGLLILETMFDFTRGSPTMVFNPGEISMSSVNRPNVFWRPSKKAIEAMLEMVGFEVVKCVINDTRITFLARAKRPSEIQASNPKIDDILFRYHKYRNYKENLDYARLEEDTRVPSQVRYKGDGANRRLIKALYVPDISLQPKWRPSFLTLCVSGAVSLAIHGTHIGVSALARCYEFALPKALRSKG